MQSYKNESINSTCPVCSDQSGKLLWSATSEEAAQHFVVKESDPERFSKLTSHLKTLWKRESIDVVTCNACQFTYCHPYMAGDEKFYALAYTSYGYPKWRWEFDLTISTVETLGLENINLLEVGSGDGAFLNKITKNSVEKANVLSTEYSVYGKSVIDKMGIECVAMDVRQLDKPEYEGKFQVICMFQVLEHLDNLKALFEKLHWLLADGGHLFISVPNAKGIEFNELNGALLDMPSNHVGRWTEKSFSEIGKIYNLEMNSFQAEASSFGAMAKQFIMYKFLRRSQFPGSLENRVYRIKSNPLFKILRLLLVAKNGLTAIPALMKMKTGDMGSVWCHFSKK